MLRRTIYRGSFYLHSSWVNEKAIPVPGGSWLAYDYRFSSRFLPLGRLVGMVLIRLIGNNGQAAIQKSFMWLWPFCRFWLSDHLVQVRKAYKRYDSRRAIHGEGFKHEQPAGITAP